MKKLLSVIATLLFLSSGIALAESVPVAAPTQTFSEDHLLLQEDYLDADGKLFVGPDGYATRKLIYNDAGKLTKEEFYNINKKLLREVILDENGNRILGDAGWCEHTITYNEKKQKIQERWLGINGEPVLQLSKVQYSGIDRAFDDAGNIIKETFYDATGNVGPNSNGTIIVERVFDENKKAIRESYYDANGALMLNPTGYAIIERKYDENARLVWYRYLDETESPIAVKGIIEYEQAYDDFGNVAKETVLDGYGNHALRPEGWCEHTTVYNEAKQKIQERYTGISGEPVLQLGKVQYSGIDRAFDEAGNTIKETYYDASGNVGPNSNGIIIVERVFDENKKAIRESYFDANGALMLNPTGYAIVERQYNENAQLVWYRYLDTDEQPVAVKGLFEMTQGYDEYGNINLEIIMDGYGRRAVGPEGWCEHRTVWDDKKQKISERYTGMDGSPVLYLGKTQYSGIDRTFDEAGNVISITYYDESGAVGPNSDGIIRLDRVFDENKKAIREAYYDANGNRMMGPSGYAVIERRYNAESQLVWYRYLDDSEQPVAVKSILEAEQAYDEFGNICRFVYLDGNGARILGPDGWCEHTTVFSENKQKASERYKSVSGEPVLLQGKVQYSGIDRAFDEAGNTIRETYYDVTGAVGPNSNGVITVERRFNENKQRTWYRYLDANNLPMALNGIAELETAYDEFGNINHEIVLDGNGNRTLHPDNWCEHLTTYNENKQKLTERWLGISGEPILYKSSYSGVDRAFDEAGNTIKEAFYDASGVIGPNANGTVIIERVFDENKKAVREAYLDASGVPMVHPQNGYAVIEREYDENARLIWYRYLGDQLQPIAVKGLFEVRQIYDEAGNLAGEITLDGNGNRVIRPEGWCEHTTEYNEAKQKTAERWLGIDGEPVLQLGKVQYSGVDRAFDEYGNTVRETYYDADGNVGPNSSGVITVIRAYDAEKHLLRTEYLDADNNPMQVSGICHMVYNYDANGNRSTETAFDESGARMLTPEGWSEHQTVYNELKQKLSDHWLGTEGEPVLYKNSYSGIDRTYDEAGNVIRETYYDAEGNIGPNASGIITVERKYDENKKVIWFRYLDADNLPMTVKGIFEMDQAYDEAGNLILERMLDGLGGKVLRAEGWHEHRITFNDKKQKIAERWLGLEEEPVLQLGKVQYSGIDRAFDEAGNVVRETYYDAEGNVGPNSSGIVTIERKYNENKKVVWYRYLSAKGTPMKVNGICEVATGYDEAGNANRTVILDGQGQRAIHPEGWCEHTTVYNENKQKIAERYLGLAGEPVLLQGKVQFSGIDREFDEAGNTVKETYYDETGAVGPNSNGVIIVTRVFDENKRVISTRYLDAAGQPMILDSLGAAGENRAYDEAGNITRDEWIGTNGNLMTGAKGWAAAEYEYDEAKHKLLEAYYDANENLIIVEGGYAKVTRAYDADGNCVSETYYNNLNRPADNAKGITIVNRVYNGNKTPIYIEYRDADDNLRIDATEGHAAISRELDAQGRVVRESYFGTDGQPMISRGKKCASIVRDYDEAGNAISVSYYDTDGSPKIVDGKHCIIRRFDASGNIIFEQFYNILGELITTSSKYATVTRRYDDQKRVLEASYFDEAGNPVLCKSGYATLLLTYAEGKNPVSRTYFDVDGSRLEIGGIHQIIYAYDDAGNKLIESYFDKAGNRVNNKSGYSTIRYTYDEDGKLADTSYFDKNGEQVRIRKGYASIETVRDAKGNIIKEIYYDENGNIKANKNNYAIIVRTFNEKKKKLSEEYRNAKDEPVTARNLGYFRVEYEYDEAGHKISERYFNVNGNPTRIKKKRGPAATTWEYNAAGKLVHVRYYDDKGNLFANASNYAGIDYWYSEDGTVTEITYVNEHGKTISGWITSGYCKIRRTYDESGKLLLKQEYLNLEDEPMRGRPGYICTIVYEYDEFGTKIRESYYDEKGELERGTRKYAIVEYSVDEDGKTVTHYYREDGSLYK